MLISCFLLSIGMWYLLDAPKNTEINYKMSFYVFIRYYVLGCTIPWPKRNIKKC